MQSQKATTAQQDFISRKHWAAGIGITLCFSLLISYALISNDAFEKFHEFSRSHEDWNLDEVALAFAATFLCFTVAGWIITSIVARQLLKAEKVRRNAELKLHQSAHLVALGTMVAGTAHSINNHLAPIVALTDLVINELPQNSEHRRDLGVVLEAARSAGDIVNRMKTFAQTNHQTKGTCDIAKTSQFALSLAAATIPSRHKIVKSIDLASGIVSVSPSAWEIVVINLVNNASDAIDSASGEITFTLETSIDIPEPTPDHINTSLKWVHIRVTDNGKGMSEEELDRVFEPFFTTKSVGKGTGLGLPETLGIIKEAGGMISITSEQGKGTQISIYLPTSEHQ